MRKYNPFVYARYHLYLLQLENFDLKRFLTVALRSFGNVPQTLRLGITWTSKIRLIVVLSVLLQLIAARYLSLIGSLTSATTGFLGVTVFILSFFVFFVFLALSTLIVWPLDRFVKRRLIKKAKRKLSTLNNLTVIGITGSYGKTTMKEVVSAVLETSYNVVKTDENKNTPLGISRQILSSLSHETDIFVVEMGAYTQGDIQELVELVKPTIVMLTGINEAHLERQGSIENTIKTKFEIVEYAPGGSTVILNRDDVRVRENAEDFIRDDQTCLWYGTQPRSDSDFTISEVTYGPEGIEFNLSRHSEDLGTFKMKFLPRYIIGNAIAALIVADKFDVRLSAVKSALRELAPPPHRLSLNTLEGMTIIDDSYNGNPDGVREAIEVLSRFNGRRKIYVTPGLVEMGEKKEEMHKEIGEKLAPVTDLVVLIKNSVTPYIKEGLLSSGFNEENILIYPTAQEAHSGMRRVIKSGDIVLFQNDWPENYL